MHEDYSQCAESGASYARTGACWLPDARRSDICRDRYHYGMHRTTLMLPDELRNRLRRIAADRGVSMATVVREALEDAVDRARPIPRSLGVGASGSTDTARRTSSERPEPTSWR
ncbi:MAG: CopG family transcriptional regulator [Solirubrobacteraceae bacterium]